MLERKRLWNRIWTVVQLRLSSKSFLETIFSLFLFFDIYIFFCCWQWTWIYLFHMLQFEFIHSICYFVFYNEYFNIYQILSKDLNHMRKSFFFYFILLMAFFFVVGYIVHSFVRSFVRHHHCHFFIGRIWHHFFSISFYCHIHKSIIFSLHTHSC